MNTHSDSEPKIAEPAKALIGLKISVAGNAISRRVYPPDNISGMMLLHTLLADALQSAGLLAGDPRCGGELNDSLYLFLTRSRAAAGIIEHKLKGLSLLRWAQIAWYCEAEDIWRTTYPQPEPIPFDQFVTPEQSARLYARNLELRALIARANSIP